MPREEGPFEMRARVNDHSYKAHLPGGLGVSATFNVADLSPYLEGDQMLNLRANSSQQGEDDGDGPWNLTMSPKAVQEVQGIAQKSRKRSRT